MIRAAASDPATMTTVMRTAPDPNRQIPLPMMEPASSGRFSPIRYPTRTVRPIARPVMIVVILCMI